MKFNFAMVLVVANVGKILWPLVPIWSTGLLPLVKPRAVRKMFY